MAKNLRFLNWPEVKQFWNVSGSKNSWSVYNIILLEKLFTWHNSQKGLPGHGFNRQVLVCIWEVCFNPKLNVSFWKFIVVPFEKDTLEVFLINVTVVYCSVHSTVQCSNLHYGFTLRISTDINLVHPSFYTQQQ